MHIMCMLHALWLDQPDQTLNRVRTTGFDAAVGLLALTLFSLTPRLVIGRHSLASLGMQGADNLTSSIALSERNIGVGSHRTSGHPPPLRFPQLPPEEARRPTMENVAKSPVPSLSELTRDKDLWFDDGSIILVAQKTMFKVYKGLLSTHSPVFADMFSSATHSDEIDDGCPVVRVSDSAQDLKWLLTHLIPKSLPQ